MSYSVFPRPSLRCGGAMAGCFHALPKSLREWQSDSARFPHGGQCPWFAGAQLRQVPLQAAKQRNNRRVMLSASSPVLWLPLTKPESGKIPLNLAGGGGQSAVLGAVTCPPFISSQSALPSQCSPVVSVGRLHSTGVTQPELPGCACASTPLHLFIASIFSL